MKGLESYYKRLKPTAVQEQETQPTAGEEATPPIEEAPTQHQAQEIPNVVDRTVLVADPGKRLPINSLTMNPVERENIRRKYLLKGPTQPVLTQFPQTFKYGSMRRFNADWYVEFKGWLEYSESKDACCCLYCYLFNMEFGRTCFGGDAFVGKGFNHWNKKGRLRDHVGEHNSIHKNQCFQAGQDLMCRENHIDITLMNISDQARRDYHIRLKTSLSCVRFLLKNGLPFRGHDESESSSRKALFLETLNFYAMPNEEMWKVVLNNAPENNKMTSPKIQKDLAIACADLTLKEIVSEIGDDFYSLLVDEARDVSIKEQMAVVIRYVNKQGEIVERFVGIVHVSDTTSASLKFAIDELLARIGLSLSKCRGQGYDGASNMRGEFNGLKSLILAENKSAYYIHCFAHQLQLALVKVAKSDGKLQEFFDMLQKMANVVNGSCKRRDIFREKQYELILERIACGDLVGKGSNQETTLRRPGDTRWGSHYGTIVSVIALFSPIISLMNIIQDDPKNDAVRTEASTILYFIDDFEFIFTLHLMEKVLGVTYELSQALQRKEQDLANAIALVKIAKLSLRNLKNVGFDNILDVTMEFCKKYDIDIPNMGDFYHPKGRSRRNASTFKFWEYFKIKLFDNVIDQQLLELDDRFDNVNTRLIECLSCLNPRNSFVAFDKEKFVEFARFYPMEFDEFCDLSFLSSSLETFILDVKSDESFANLKGIGDLAQKMVEKQKHIVYPMVYLLVKLALILPVATTSVERVFSAMNLVKDKLRNRIGDEWFHACMLTYVESESFDKIKDDDIMQYFQAMKPRRMIL